MPHVKRIQLLWKVPNFGLNSICRGVMHSNNNVVKYDIQLSSTVNDVNCLGSVMYSMSGIVYERHEQLHGKTSKRVRQAMAWSYRLLADRECDNRET